MANAGRILIIPRGEYNEETTYEMLDLVLYKGISWLAKTSVAGIEPNDDNSEYWYKFTDINLVNNLTTEEEGCALDASQGKLLMDEISAINGSLEYHFKRLGYYIEPSEVRDLTTIDRGIYLFNGWDTYTNHKPFDNAWGIWIKTADESLTNVYEIVINFDTGEVYKSNNYGDFSSLAEEYAEVTCAINANPIRCFRFGKTVRIMNGGTITATLTAGTGYKLGTIPERFRPQYTVAKNIVYRSGLNDVTATGYLEITSVGDVNFIPYEVPTTGGTIRFDETFI